MKTKTNKREKEIIWNLAYSLIFTTATNSPKVSVAYSKKDLFLTYAACRLQTCCTSAWLHWTPHSNAQLSHSSTEGTSPSRDKLFSWQIAEVQESRPIHESTFKASPWTWAYILSSRILLAKVSHMANPDKGWRSRCCLWGGTGSHRAECGCISFREESMELGKINLPHNVNTMEKS